MADTQFTGVLVGRDGRTLADPIWGSYLWMESGDALGHFCCDRSIANRVRFGDRDAWVHAEGIGRMPVKFHSEPASSATFLFKSTGRIRPAIERSALMIATDLIEQGGMPEQAEQVRELIREKAAEEPTDAGDGRPGGV